MNKSSQLKFDHNFFTNIKNKLIKENTLPVKFTDKENNKYNFQWIVNSSIKQVLELRNSREIIKNFTDTRIISINEHKNFLDNYSKLKRIDFMVESNSTKEMIGGVNITYRNNIWQIGKYIGNPEFLGKGIAKQMTLNLIEYFNKFFPKEKELFSITKSTNIVNIALNEKIGFEFYKKIDDQFILMKKNL